MRRYITDVLTFWILIILQGTSRQTPPGHRELLIYFAPFPGMSSRALDMYQLEIFRNTTVRPKHFKCPLHFTTRHKMVATSENL